MREFSEKAYERTLEVLAWSSISERLIEIGNAAYLTQKNPREAMV